MIGIIADDLTGSTDAGVMFTKRGCTVKVFLTEVEFEDHAANADALVIDTESRGDSPDAAYRKVRESTQRLLPLSNGMIFKKIDSCFRGNVGAETDGLLDELGANFTIVVPAFPANGRITKGGYHYLRGKLLEESEMAHDPANPTTDSFLPRVLEKQTRRRVGLLDWRVIGQGAEAAGEKISELRKTCEIIIADATTQGDLLAIASATRDLSLNVEDGRRFALCGSSGLAEQFANLACSNRRTLSCSRPSRPAVLGAPTLVIAGSTAQSTLRQNHEAKRSGFAVIGIDAIKAIESQEARKSEARRVVQSALAEIPKRPVVISSGEDERTVTAALELAESKGLSLAQKVQIICGLLAEITERIVDEANVQKLIVTGGATAFAVCRRLGIIGLRLLEEVKLGVPSCLTIGRNDMLIVLKPGAYGDESFYSDAVAYLDA